MKSGKRIQVSSSPAFGPMVTKASETPKIGKYGTGSASIPGSIGQTKRRRFVLTSSAERGQEIDGNVEVSPGIGRYYLRSRREIVKHMSLASLAMDGRGGVSAVTHVCNEECEGKHPDPVR